MNKHTHTHTHDAANAARKKEFVDSVRADVFAGRISVKEIDALVRRFVASAHDDRALAGTDDERIRGFAAFARTIRRDLLRHFGEFSRAVDTMRAAVAALAESDDERARIETRLANVIGWLRVVAPDYEATGRPFGVIGEGRVTVSLEARVDAPGDGCGFAVEFVESGDPVCETRFASLRDALGALISAQLAADEVDEDEEDIEITFSDSAADGNPRQFRARTGGLSLREARAALNAGVLTMIEC